MSATAEKIRIAYLIDTISSDKAGTEKQMLQIIAKLDRTRFIPTLVCLYESPFMTAMAPPCETVTLGYRGFLHPSFPVVLHRYLELLRQRRFDLVQTFFEDAMFVGFLGRLFAPGSHRVIVSRRDLGVGADEPFYHRIFRRLHPMVFRVVDGLAANAAAIRERVTAAGVPPGKVRLIRNGMALPPPPREKPPIFRERDHDLWVAVVANLKPVKRIDLFLEAFALAASRHPGLRLGAVVLGEGRLRGELEKLASALGLDGRVRFAGAVDNVTDYLYHCDVGVLCSDSEGLSNALLEYMGCALPVVVTAVGGNTELVDGDNGFAVPAGDAEALSGALCRLLADPELRRRMGAASLERVRAVTGWEAVMGQWEKYYLETARAGGDHA